MRSGHLLVSWRTRNRASHLKGFAHDHITRHALREAAKGASVQWDADTKGLPQPLSWRKEGRVCVVQIHTTEHVRGDQRGISFESKLDEALPSFQIDLFHARLRLDHLLLTARNDHQAVALPEGSKRHLFPCVEAASPEAELANDGHTEEDGRRECEEGSSRQSLVHDAVHEDTVVARDAMWVQADHDLLVGRSRTQCFRHVHAEPNETPEAVIPPLTT
mmetsp:Transcript_43893/g.115945  ORF Transcript_43893/g.115945 Transcript_43893/m.115945 type:complete len:219 (+) Transcript_43893:330-986(+)